MEMIIIQMFYLFIILWKMALNIKYINNKYKYNNDYYFNK